MQNANKQKHKQREQACFFVFFNSVQFKVAKSEIFVNLL